MKILKISALITAILIMLCGCVEQNTNDYATTHKDEKSTSVTTENSANDINENDDDYCVEYPSVIFRSIEELTEAVQRYKTDPEMQSDPVMIINEFDKLDIKHIPVMNSEDFILDFIEINKYSVFYFYKQAQADKFDYDTGLEVAFSREGGGIEPVIRQFNAVCEEDGSFFVTNVHSWFIPYEDSFYYITYPKGEKEFDKSIITLVPVKNEKTVDG